MTDGKAYDDIPMTALEIGARLANTPLSDFSDKGKCFPVGAKEVGILPDDLKVFHAMVANVAKEHDALIIQTDEIVDRLNARSKELGDEFAIVGLGEEYRAMLNQLRENEYKVNRLADLYAIVSKAFRRDLRKRFGLNYKACVDFAEGGRVYTSNSTDNVAGNAPVSVAEALRQFLPQGAR